MVEDLQYRLYHALAKDCRSQTIIEFSREKLLSVRYNVDKSCKREALYTWKFTADVTDGFIVTFCTVFVLSSTSSGRSCAKIFTLLCQQILRSLMLFCRVFIVSSAGLDRLLSIFDSNHYLNSFCSLFKSFVIHHYCSPATFLF